MIRGVLVSLWLVASASPAARSAPTTDAPKTPSRRRFAVLCAGTPHDARHYRWYWGATSGMFDVLRTRYGYEEKNVYFLFCDTHDDDPRVDHPATKANIRQVFTELAKRMRPGDTLFGFFVGHGSHAGTHSYYETTDGRLFDEELDKLRRKLPAKELRVHSMQQRRFRPCPGPASRHHRPHQLHTDGKQRRRFCGSDPRCAGSCSHR